MNSHALAGLVAAILLSLAAIHVYWAVGGRRGAAVAVPSRGVGLGLGLGSEAPVFQPGPAVTAAVAVALGLAALIVLGRAGVAPSFGPERLYRAASWMLGAVFAVRAIGEFRYVGITKRVRSTAFARLDTWVYTPLCAALSAALFVLAAA